MDCKIIDERKLESNWDTTISDDCPAFHMIDAEEELAYEKCARKPTTLVVG